MLKSIKASKYINLSLYMSGFEYYEKEASAYRRPLRM